MEIQEISQKLISIWEKMSELDCQLFGCGCCGSPIISIGETEIDEVKMFSKPEKSIWDKNIKYIISFSYEEVEYIVLEDKSVIIWK